MQVALNQRVNLFMIIILETLIMYFHIKRLKCCFGSSFHFYSNEREGL